MEFSRITLGRTPYTHTHTLSTLFSLHFLDLVGSGSVFDTGQACYKLRLSRLMQFSCSALSSRRMACGRESSNELDQG